jgi:hypothetical protein
VAPAQVRLLAGAASRPALWAPVVWSGQVRPGQARPCRRPAIFFFAVSYRWPQHNKSAGHEANTRTAAAEPSGQRCRPVTTVAHSAAACAVHPRHPCSVHRPGQWGLLRAGCSLATPLTPSILHSPPPSQVRNPPPRSPPCLVRSGWLWPTPHSVPTLPVRSFV